MKKNHFVIITVLVFFSCQKEVPEPDESRSRVGVYVAGYLPDDDSPFTGSPAYREDGSLRQSDAVDGYYEGRALSTAVPGKDLYVEGYRRLYDLPKWARMFRRNDMPGNVATSTRFPHFSFELTSPGVSNNNIYMASHPALWGPGETATYSKNESPIELADGPASSIAVSVNNLFVAGLEDGLAKYWANGNSAIPGDVSKYPEAFCIFLAKEFY